MKGLKTILSFRHAKVFFLFLFLFLLLKNIFFYSSFLILLILYSYITKDKSVIFLFIIFIILSLSFYKKNLPDINEGRIVEIKEKYIIIQKGNTKILAYTNDEFYYDAIIQFKGDFKEIEDTYGFYRYSYKNYLNNKNVYYYTNLEKYKIIKNNITLRYLLQKIINNKKNKKLLKLFLLNINNNDIEDYIYLYSFSYYGIIYALDILLNRFINKKKLKIIRIVLYIFLNILYAFPLALTYHLLLEIFDEDNNYKWIIRIIMILIYKNSCINPLFIIPIINSYLPLYNDKYKKYFYQTLISATLFNSINLFYIFFFKYLLLIKGLSWFYSILVLIIDNGYIILEFIYKYLYFFYELLNIKGSIFGFGLIFFLLFISIFKNIKYKYLLNFLILFLFQLFGLFHPLAEVTFINVGQGDAIVIREPFNNNNILIDTGKRSQLNNLCNYLDAKGIYTINTLFISHHDSDHDGNMNDIIDKYNVNHVYDKHFNNIIINKLLFYDLNTIDNNDKNESSLVLYTKINNISFLFMGDASSYTEYEIIKKYPNLRADILKLSHHGSITGTTKELLDTVMPKLGIISSGKYEIYHHPSNIILERLKQYHIKYLDTKTEGDISIFFIGNISFIITSNKHFSFLINDIDII